MLGGPDPRPPVVAPLLPFPLLLPPPRLFDSSMESQLTSCHRRLAAMSIQIACFFLIDLSCIIKQQSGIMSIKTSGAGLIISTRGAGLTSD